MKSKNAIAHEAASMVWEWLCRKYQVQAEIPQYYLSVKGRFPKYVHSKRRVRIAARRLKWATYVKKRVGAYANWIPCSLHESWCLQFVHEFTHAVQGDQRRRYSEMETTRNEIEFARLYFPHLAEHLTFIEKQKHPATPG